MLKNDEIFWRPTESENAPYLSWGSSGGDFGVLWDHTRKRWDSILRTLDRAGIPAPRGRIVEFGSGMGLLDELIEDADTRITMLDNNSDYIAARPRPLSARCRHVLWTKANLDMLQSEPSEYDWLMSIAVFYHVDDATAVGLIAELGKLLRPAGRVLIDGFTVATADAVRAAGNRRRLFARYPTYLLDLDLLRDALAPEYREVWRDGLLVYEKR
jgi:SAM-dependent methyltransferase